jgi:hypothetical protein
MDEYKETDPKVRDANALIKQIMISLDKWYPSNQICDEAFKEKQYLRSKIMDGINKISKLV